MVQTTRFLASFNRSRLEAMGWTTQVLESIRRSQRFLDSISTVAETIDSLQLKYDLFSQEISDDDDSVGGEVTNFLDTVADESLNVSDWAKNTTETAESWFTLGKISKRVFRYVLDAILAISFSIIGNLIYDYCFAPPQVEPSGSYRETNIVINQSYDAEEVRAFSIITKATEVYTLSLIHI